MAHGGFSICVHRSPQSAHSNSLLTIFLAVANSSIPARDVRSNRGHTTTLSGESRQRHPGTRRLPTGQQSHMAGLALTRKFKCTSVSKRALETSPSADAKKQSSGSGKTRLGISFLSATLSS